MLSVNQRRQRKRTGIRSSLAEFKTVSGGMVVERISRHVGTAKSCLSSGVAGQVIGDKLT